MLPRFILGAGALGLAIMLAPGQPVTVPIQTIVTPHHPVFIPDIQITDLPLAWQKLATCESGQRHNAVSGKRGQFQGYFQIEYPRTWEAHGGDSGIQPKDATLKDQFDVALHIYVDRGYKPWPYCGKFLKAYYGK